MPCKPAASAGLPSPALAAGRASERFAAPTGTRRGRARGCRANRPAMLASFGRRPWRKALVGCPRASYCELKRSPCCRGRNGCPTRDVSATRAGQAKGIAWRSAHPALRAVESPAIRQDPEPAIPSWALVCRHRHARPRRARRAGLARGARLSPRTEAVNQRWLQPSLPTAFAQGGRTPLCCAIFRVIARMPCPADRLWVQHAGSCARLGSGALRSRQRPSRKAWRGSMPLACRRRSISAGA